MGDLGLNPNLNALITADDGKMHSSRAAVTPSVRIHGNTEGKGRDTETEDTYIQTSMATNTKRNWANPEGTKHFDWDRVSPTRI